MTRDHAAALEKLFGSTPEDQGVSDAVKKITIAKRRAEASAMRLLAERECPETVREFGRAHGIEAFAEMTWINGFEAGMRVAALAGDTNG